MLRFLRRIAILAPAWAITAAASSPEDLFKWGEYDSLIQILAPREQARVAMNAADSAEAARGQLMLGVAYFAVGRIDAADGSFRRACEWDPGAELDPYYVTPEIHARFESIASGRRRAVPSRAGREAAPPPQAPKVSAASARAAPPRARSWVWWTVGTAMAAGVAAGTWYYMETAGSSGGRTTTIDTR